MHHISRTAIAALLVTAVACGDKQAAPESAAPAPAAPAGPVTPCPTCKIIVVKMITAGEGNYYEPKEISANEGDVLRFTLGVGVHNVNFFPDSNPGRSGLPPASELLQLPGQTKDILLNFGTGKFYFHCDPHWMIGMIGHVEVSK